MLSGGVETRGGGAGLGGAGTSEQGGAECRDAAE
jgi:hypothetical protein